MAYVVESTVIRGTDYMRLSGVRKVPAGKRTVTISVVPVGDGGGPGTHTVVLLLESRPDHYTVGTTGKVR